MSIFQSDSVVRRITNCLFKWMIPFSNTLIKFISSSDRFRYSRPFPIGIGVAQLPWVIFASGMSESEEKIGVARLTWVVFASGMSESEEKIGVARLLWIIFACGMSKSEDESITASSYPSSAPSCSCQFFARRSDMIDFAWSKILSI